MRARLSGDASLRCAIDQRSGAIGVSRFTRSSTSSRWCTERLLCQWKVAVRPARRGPSQRLVELLLLLLGGRVVVVHAPGDVLADPVEPQPVVAEALRQHRGQRLEVVEFVAAARRAQAVYDAHGERAVAPHLEQRPIGVDRQVVAAGIEDAGDAELLSVRKNARVPATCCAKAGGGSLSNSSLMVRLSAAIQPVGLPSGSVSILRRDASSASRADPERLEPAGA